MAIGPKLNATALTFMLLVGDGGQALAQSCARIEAIEAYAETQTPPQGAICARFVGQSGEKGISCHWDFPFRNPAAIEFADALLSNLQICRTGAEGGPDTQVNHPDSYDLRTWDGPRGTYHVSVKDKGALERTLVFFRWSAALLR